MKFDNKRELVWLLAIFLVLMFSSAYAADTIVLPDYDEKSEASPHAYVADSMELRKKMPFRPDAKPMQFFYKHCREIGEKYYYSKTAYECSEDLF